MDSSIYTKLATVLTTHDIDELGLLHIVPPVDELPETSAEYYPLVVVDTKLGIPIFSVPAILAEAQKCFVKLRIADAIHSAQWKELDIVTRVMTVVKPDNYTAMNTRKQLIVSKLVAVKDELVFLNLVFTIPKHSKSSVAWHHRQWLYTVRATETASDSYMDADEVGKELGLCTRAATLYPRNYYAWTFRHWLLDTTIIHHRHLLETEFSQARRWVELNVSDHSGVQHLERVLQALSPLPFDFQDHIVWLNDLIKRFPGHEALWCHRRFCVHFAETLSLNLAQYYKEQHQFVEDRIGAADDATLEKAAMNTDTELALRFGLWISMLEKKHDLVNHQKRAMYLAKLQSTATIPIVYHQLEYSK
ncbi:uncharacterized protein BYT42DRAFT_589937 [Radiomyces spectabilis]|uniref:uncharacterized protein n=1 Tax=Radiomyces spectabilis TaxID=64574 RepID=UPI0022209C8A|nr:uncharacterized protein BYT42DRAFT_589937 [Radiomyces spectabilis]KAI8364650.1 hypothetical protein BYT42DRAFT_589937 [Radiomyces spectabilis]